MGLVELTVFMFVTVCSFAYSTGSWCLCFTLRYKTIHKLLIMLIMHTTATFWVAQHISRRLRMPFHCNLIDYLSRKYFALFVIVLHWRPIVCCKLNFRVELSGNVFFNLTPSPPVPSGSFSFTFPFPGHVLFPSKSHRSFPFPPAASPVLVVSHCTCCY